MTDFITRPSISRLSRKAGVKSLSDDTYPIIYDFLESETEEIIKFVSVLNDEQSTKTIMSDDLVKALKICGYHVAQSQELNSTNNK